MVREDNFWADSLHTCVEHLYLLISLQVQTSLFQSASNAWDMPDTRGPQQNVVGFQGSEGINLFIWSSLFLKIN